MVDLDMVRNVDLTIRECVLARNALRMYAEELCKHIQDALNNNNYASALVHEMTLRETIVVFGKLLTEKEYE